MDAWTLGHSTRNLEVFLAALRSFEIQVVADVRRFPTSRRHPWFNADELKKSLFHAQITYEYLGDELGGFRERRPGSAHSCLAGSGFQGYADYQHSPGYEAGVRKVLGSASTARTCLLCAERNPKACHRKLLADDLVLLRHVRVHHILDAGREAPHTPTPGARVADGRLLYAPPRLDEFDPGAKS